MAKRGAPALVGGETLLGREIREVLEASGLGVEPRLIAGGEEESSGLAAEIGGRGGMEVTILETLGAGALAEAEIVILAGTPDSARKTAALATGAATRLVDATGALGGHPGAVLRAPALELPGAPVPARVHVLAHPAAVSVGLFLRRLHRLQPVRAAVVTAFEPASERGQRGLDELHQQTVRLLSFQSLPKDVFDSQIGFNMLSEYGEDAPLALAEVENRIASDLSSLPGDSGGAPAPSLRLVQAPVFHGYSFEVWVEFENPPAVEALLDGLAGPGIEVRRKGEEAPSNAGAAGQSGITVGAASADIRNGRAAWFWVVSDNLRTSAEGVREVVRGLLA